MILPPMGRKPCQSTGALNFTGAHRNLQNPCFRSKTYGVWSKKNVPPHPHHTYMMGVHVRSHQTSRSHWGKSSCAELQAEPHAAHIGKASPFDSSHVRIGFPIPVGSIVAWTTLTGASSPRSIRQNGQPSLQDEQRMTRSSCASTSAAHLRRLLCPVDALRRRRQLGQPLPHRLRPHPHHTPSRIGSQGECGAVCSVVLSGWHDCILAHLECIVRSGLW